LESGYSVHFDKGANIAINVGVMDVDDSCVGFRSDLTFSYGLYSDRDDVAVKYKQYLGMLNTYIDIKPSPSLAIYPNIGLGAYGNSYLGDEDFDDQNIYFVAKLGLGLRYAISEDHTIDINTYALFADVPMSFDKVGFSLGYKFWF
jgi:hypothetical protein